MPFPSDGALLDRLRSPRLFPHEWIILAYLITALMLLETMPVTYPRMALLLAYALPIFVITLLSLAVAFFHHRRRRGLEVSFVGEGLAIARIVFPLMLAWATHFLLKSFVFVINSRTWDRELAVWDQRIHFGFNPSLFVTTLFQAPAFLVALDVAYSGLYFFIVLGYSAVLLGILPLRRKLAFGSSFTLLWVIGSSLYVAFPSWGPVYVFSNDFIETLQYMPMTVGVQRVLYEEISSLVRSPEALRYVRYGSVAAFPSLHVAVVALYALASRHVSRRWYHANVALVIVMVIGSVVTGYHYLLDAWAGLGLALLVWFTTTRYFVGKDPAVAGEQPRLPSS